MRSGDHRRSRAGGRPGACGRVARESRAGVAHGRQRGAPHQPGRDRPHARRLHADGGGRDAGHAGAAARPAGRAELHLHELLPGLLGPHAAVARDGQGGARGARDRQLRGGHRRLRHAERHARTHAAVRARTRRHAARLDLRERRRRDDRASRAGRRLHVLRVARRASITSPRPRSSTRAGGSCCRSTARTSRRRWSSSR